MRFTLEALLRTGNPRGDRPIPPKRAEDLGCAAATGSHAPGQGRIGLLFEKLVSCLLARGKLAGRAQR